MRSDFKDILFVLVIWAIFAAIGFAVILTYTPFPVAAAEEAILFDEAFTVLTLFAIPVFTFVIAMLVYSALRFRVRGEPTEDGPPQRGHKPMIITWFAGSAVLTAVLIVFPGLTGILELRRLDQKPADIVVQVEAQRFAWTLTYPEYGVFSRKELVLPVDEHARFDITVKEADDAVLHSFWVPAFRIKIDAVPGMITTTAATPNLVGSFDSDVNYRLQCAEMCGVGHNGMMRPIRVVERAEFDEWIAEQSPIPQ